jgi:hypothetical protein
MGRIEEALRRAKAERDSATGSRTAVELSSDQPSKSSEAKRNDPTVTANILAKHIVRAADNCEPCCSKQ